MEKFTPPISSPLGSGIFGAVVAHFAMILFILMFSFGATIPGLYKLWLTLLPVPIIVGVIAGLLNGLLQTFVRKEISFMLASVTILISYPVSSIIVDILVFDLKIIPEPFSYSILFFGLGYLLTGIVIESAIIGMIIILSILWNRISRFIS